MAKYQEHPCEEVRQAIVRLSDALCSWERSTSLQSVFIVREQGGFVYRATSGKPVIDVLMMISDEELKQGIDT